MKKISLVSLILLLFLTLNNIISPYNIPTNQLYEYDVKKAEVYVKLDDTSYSGKGFEISNINFNQRTTIQAFVNSLGGDNVLWTLTSGEASLAKLADWNLVDESSLSSNILNPFSIIQNFLSNPMLTTVGLGLIFYPFLGTNRTIDFFKDLKNQTHYQYTFFIPKLDNVQYEAFYEEIDQLVIFESLVSGGLNQNLTSPEFNISFKHHSQLVYDISIGLLYGSRFLSEGSGVFENKTVEFSFESHIELKNYNLPKLVLSNDNFLVRWVLIGSSGSIVVIVITVFFVRYKKRIP
ncbi:MAG: hypothetical protein KGD59_03530 [Candidatus Heimdallarchaeota archaeon]|nr:hypothetical protein [Candidatus Heimdallarchaeota archaeon]MBY8993596.1 hypothetical protein [Candidatus Heimdallarchaeota archaeon]